MCHPDNKDLQYSVDAVEIINYYFPTLSPDQYALFHKLGPLYIYWNARVNLISRKDIDHLYVHHVLHSLAIAKVISFCSDTHILDLGTGGGFPGIPLAIMFPSAHFHLVDSIGKKIEVVQKIVHSLGLKNVTLASVRGEQVTGRYDFIVGRAVADLRCFYSWVNNKISDNHKNKLKNGILYLKGEPTEQLPLSSQLYAIRDFFKEPFFREKYLVHSYVTTTSKAKTCPFGSSKK